MRKLLLKSFQSPGDIVMLTAALRDLHRACPGQFITDVRTSAQALFENNPFVTPLVEGDRDVEAIEMHYPLIHQSNQRPYHFIHGYHQHLEERLGVQIPVSQFCGDIHLSEQESQSPPHVELGIPEHFWIVIAGGKYDFTAKWWNPQSYQAVVDALTGQVPFVQCGEAGHWHPRLSRVTDLVGQTTLRELVRLMYHADGVLCPVTLAMHLAAAVPTRSDRPKHRAAVVVAGGREPPHWEAYPTHQFIHTLGALPCCSEGACWKSRCQTVGDGDLKDRYDLCPAPVQVSPELRIPQCMAMITPQDVIRRIELYYDGGALHYRTPSAPASPLTHREAPASVAKPAIHVLLRFGHGLGDAVQFTIVLKHLQKYRPDWQVDVASLYGKHAAMAGLCRRSYCDQEARPHESAYDRVFQIGWHEAAAASRQVPSTKVTRCLMETFGMVPDLSLYRYEIRRSEAARARAADYLRRVSGDRQLRDGRYPVMLFHYQGNTSAGEKNLGHDQAREICHAAMIEELVPVILDWDKRSPLPDQKDIFCPVVGEGDLWGHTGTGDAETLAALIDQAFLMVGVDSGPVHVAGATTTPTLAIWTGHFAGQYYDLAENVTHLVPHNWQESGLARDPAAAEFFREQYRFIEYRGVVDALRGALACACHPCQTGALVQSGRFWIRRDNQEQDLVIVRDIFEGDAYQTGLLESSGDGEVVVDIGAHIGVFARHWHTKNPRARIICVEACPENLDALRANVSDFAEVVHAACTYEPGSVALLNAVRPNCESTGGSVVVPVEQMDDSPLKQPGYAYWHDRRELPKVTLEDLLERFQIDHIDVLKLDCEGSEYSILGKSPSLRRVHHILGEYHGRERWNAFRQDRLAGWLYRLLLDPGEGSGLFQDTNPVWPPKADAGDFVAQRSPDLSTQET